MSLLAEFQAKVSSKDRSSCAKLLGLMVEKNYPGSIIQYCESVLNGLNSGQYRENFISSLDANSSSQNIKIAYLFNDNDKMTHYYRAENISDNFVNSESGVSLRLIDMHAKDFVISSLENFDVIVITRAGSSGIDNFKESLLNLQKKGAKLVFDIDDMVVDPSEVLNVRHIATRSKDKLQESLDHSSILKDLLCISDISIGSTPYLCQKLEKITCKKSFLIPNTINNKIFLASEALIDAREALPNSVFTRIGYFSGTKTHKYDFQLISQALHKLLSDNKSVELLIAGHLDEDILEPFKEFGNRLILIPFQSYEKSLKLLSRCHINLIPLESINPFVHHKSELKLFDASIYAIPSIASPTDNLTSYINHGVNGYFAQTESEWLNLLKKLVDNPSLRETVGFSARNTISNRFLSSNVVKEYQLLLTELRRNRLPVTYTPRFIPSASSIKPISQNFKVSVVSILYKKDSEILYFVDALSRQKFNYSYELVLVNDDDPGIGSSVVENFIKFAINQPGRNSNFSIKIVNNLENRGNCISRNVGISNASGDIIIVVDADCLLNHCFIQEHFDAHISGICDVAIGPKGIETNELHPNTVLNMCDISKHYALNNANPQDPLNPHSYINLVTRNFSISSSYLKKYLIEDLFDPQFSYSTAKDSGFGWEDVELGVRLYKQNARFFFLENTASIHISHPPTVPNKDKPFRSLKNFTRLLNKHPEVEHLNKSWFAFTAKAILNWCTSADQKRASEDKLFRSLQDKTTKFSPYELSIFQNYKKNTAALRVASYRWHVPHQYELYKMGGAFDLFTGFGLRMVDEWEYQKRPMPLNVNFYHAKEFNPQNYNLAIIHVDENSLNPEICNKYVDRVPSAWGKPSKFLQKSAVKNKVFLMHGTPQFYRQYDPNFREAKDVKLIEESIRQFRDFVGNNLVICNSYEAQKEWNFPNSRVIWQGFDPSEFPFDIQEKDSSRPLRVLVMNERSMVNRPIYNGLQNYLDIKEGLQDAPNISLCTMTVPRASAAFSACKQKLAFMQYKAYINELLSFDVYLNTTNRSPMPRTRGEAMMAGVLSLSFRNHDVDKFIDNGVDGYYVDSADEAVNILVNLSNNDALVNRIRRASKQKAIKVFNQSRFISSWHQIINNLAK